MAINYFCNNAFCSCIERTHNQFVHFELTSSLSLNIFYSFLPTHAFSRPHLLTTWLSRARFFRGTVNVENIISGGLSGRYENEIFSCIFEQASTHIPRAHFIFCWLIFMQSIASCSRWILLFKNNENSTKSH